MAMTYQNFASLGVNLNRQQYGPLDISNVFTSTADLKYYLTKGTFTEGVSEYWYKNADEKIVPYPYEGQILATIIDGIVDVYVLSLDAEGNFQTEEIGSKVEVDGTTIIKNAEGKLSIVAPIEPDSSKTYNFSYSNGVYSWIPVDTSTADGQAQVIENLQSRTTIIENIINGKAESSEGAGDSVIGLIDKIENNTSAIIEEKTTREAAIGVPSKPESSEGAGDAIVATGLYKAIEEAEARAKAYADDNDSDTIYDDTQVKTNTSDISAIKTTLKDIYTKSEIDSAIAAINHFSTEIVESTEDMVSDKVLYLIHDSTATGADKYNEYLVIGGIPTMIGDTSTDLSGYTTKVELENSIKDFVTKTEFNNYDSNVSATYATQDALSGHITEAEQTYAKKTDVASALDEKVDTTILSSYYTKIEIDNKGYAIASEVESDLAEALQNYYTKEQILSKDETYTKEDVNTLLERLTGNSSETIESVKNALDTYIQNLDTEIYGADAVESWTDEEGNYIPQYTTTDSRIDSAIKKANDAQAQADKGVADAAAANSALTALEQGQVTTNKNDIDTVKTRLTALETAKSNHETRISIIENEVADLKDKNTTISSSISTINNSIIELQTKDTAIESNIATIQGTLNNKVDNTTLQELEDNIYTKTEVNNIITNLEINTIKESISSNSDKIDEEIERAKSAESNLSSTLNSIIGEDENKTIRTIANEEVAKIVDSAPESFDTLKEIADWIQNDTTGAAAMANKIASHSTILEGFGETGQPSNVKDFIESSIAAAEYELPIATLTTIGGIKSADTTIDNAIQVSDDGIATIARVNVNTLVQTDGDTIVLYGGRSVN